MDLSALKAAAGSLLPMGGTSVPIIQGRILRIDGDGLAYNCAGNDETEPHGARSRVREKIAGFQQACGAEYTVIHLTGSGSHKGHRYAVAREKPYQGKRSSSRRPKNWQHLRDLLEAGEFGEVTIDYDREADDRFAQYGWADPTNTVIATQDKDMNMVPGYHINWNDNQMFYLAPGTFEAVVWDKTFGMKWFWLQMLHGDSVDNIPGVPKAYGKLCGEVTAAKMLAQATHNGEAAFIVGAAYQSYYEDDWRHALLEQAALLWMRRGEDATWYDCLNTGGPLSVWSEEGRVYDNWADAYSIIQERIQEATEINELAATQDN
jgi:hypothetical protein